MKSLSTDTLQRLFISCLVAAVAFLGLFGSDWEEPVKTAQGYFVFRALPRDTKIYKSSEPYILKGESFVAEAYKPVLVDNLKDRRDKISLIFQAPGYEESTQTYTGQEYKALLQSEQYPPKDKPPVRLKIKSYGTVFLSKLKNRPLFLLGALLALGGAWFFRKQHEARLRLEMMRELADNAGGEDAKYVGKRISDYLLVKQVGKGGQSRTYKAVLHHNFGTKREEEGVVAIKILESSDDWERQDKEYNILRKMNHRNVMRVHEKGTTDPEEFGKQLHYIVGEFIDGIDMDEITLQKKVVGQDGDGKDIIEEVYTLFKPEEVAKYFKPIADGLQHIHKAGVTHRDIKPQNIMLRGGKEPVLIDFGLSKTELDDRISRVTKTGQIFGTPVYLSPEQFSNTRGVEAPTDQYATGVMLFHMLSGRLPHTNNTSLHFYNLDKRIPGTPLHEAAPEIPLAVCEVVDKMLHPQFEQRYENIQAAYEAFEKALKG